MTNTNTCVCNCQNLQQVQVPVTGLTLGLDMSDVATCTTVKAVDYSYEEHFTGAHWVDGKKIYRKVFKIEEFPPTGKAHGIPYGIKGINEMLFVSGTGIRKANTTSAFSLNFPSTSATICMWTGSEADNIVIYPTNEALADSYGYVFLEYTCVDR